MRKFLQATRPFMAAVTLLILGICTVSMAGTAIDGIIPIGNGPSTVPEIDAATGASAVALIASAVLVIRGLRKR